VNVAARLQQNSNPGYINVSQTTYDATTAAFHFTARGKIAIKNRGEVDMYFAERRK